MNIKKHYSAIKGMITHANNMDNLKYMMLGERIQTSKLLSV